MKRFVCGVLMAAAWAAGAQTAVLFSLQQMTGSPLKRQITVTSLDGVRIVGTNTVFPEVKVMQPGTNGTVTTNLLTGNYRATVKGLAGYVDGFVPDTNVVVSWAVDCSSIPAGSVNLPSFYTKAQVDALLVAATNGLTAGLSVSNVCLPQISGIPTNSIPANSTTASATNWFFANIGGTVKLIATNYEAGGWITKDLAP